MQVPQEPFVPIDHVAQYFSVSISTVRTWVKSGMIPRDTYIQLGNTYRFQISAITKALTGANTPEMESDEVQDESDDDPQLDLDFGESDDTDDTDLDDI